MALTGVTVYSPEAVASDGVEPATYWKVYALITLDTWNVPLYTLSLHPRTSTSVSLVTLCATAQTTVTVDPDDVISSTFSIAGARIEPVENAIPLPD